MKLLNLFNPLLWLGFCTLHFDNSSNSSSSSASTTNNADNRLVASDNAFGNTGTMSASGNSSINVNNPTFVTQSIKDLIDLTKNTFQGLNDIQAASNAAVEHISATSTEAISKATGATVAVTDTNRYLVAGGLAVVAIVAIKLWAK